MKKLVIGTSFSLFLMSGVVQAQYVTAKGNDATTPLHLLKPDYVTPYGAPTVDAVKEVLTRVHHYLDSTTPAKFVDRRTGTEVKNAAAPDTNTMIKQGDYRLTSYEWGVTYSGMLLATEATGDKRFADYTVDRVNFIANAVPAFRALYQKYPKGNNPFRQPVAPHALDDAGAVCAAMIKTLRLGGNANKATLRPLIDSFINYISNKEFRLSDGTLARNRPQKNTIVIIAQPLARPQ